MPEILSLMKGLHTSQLICLNLREKIALRPVWVCAKVIPKLRASFNFEF